jgi:hypothetical protein
MHFRLCVCFIIAFFAGIHFHTYVRPLYIYVYTRNVECITVVGYDREISKYTTAVVK